VDTMASLVVGKLNPVVVTKGQNSEVKRLAAPEFAALSYCQTKLKRRNPKRVCLKVCGADNLELPQSH
jgi:hypothetical protein